MLRVPAVFRSLVLAVAASVTVAVTGCGSDAPVTPDLSEQERQQMIRKDAEQIQKERQKPAQRSPR